MEENKTNPETKEEKVNEEPNVEASNLGDIESKASGFEGQVNELKTQSDKERVSIENLLKEADNDIRAKKLEFFLKDLNERLSEEQNKEVNLTSFEQLTVEQRAEFEKYTLPEEEMKKLYEESKKKIEDLTSERNEKFDSFGKDIDGLYEELQAKRAEAEQNLNSPDEKVVEQAKKDLEKIEELEEKIGVPHGKSEIRKTLAQSLINHDEARMNAVRGMELVYGADRVRNDTDFINKLVPKKQREEYQKQAQEQDTQQIDDNAEPTRENQGANNGQPGNGQNAQKPKNGQQAPQQQAAAAPQQPGVPVGNVVGEPAYQDVSAHNLAILGYTNDKVMDFNTSKSMLELFTADALTNRERMDMINDPETRDKLLKAMKIAGDSFRPSKRRAFDYARNKLISFAKDPLMKQALADMGVDDPQNIKKEFNQMYNDYEAKKSDLVGKIALAKDDEVKEQLKGELDELNSKYASIINAKEFTKGVKKVKTIKSTIKEFAESLTKKSTYKALAAGAVEKVKDFAMAKEEPTMDDPNINGLDKDVQNREAQNIEEKSKNEQPQNEFLNNLHGGVTKDEDLTNEELKYRFNNAPEAQSRMSRVQRREQAELDRIGKENGRHSKEYLEKKAAMEKPKAKDEGPEI